MLAKAIGEDFVRAHLLSWTDTVEVVSNDLHETAHSNNRDLCWKELKAYYRRIGYEEPRLHPHRLKIEGFEHSIYTGGKQHFIVLANAADHSIVGVNLLLQIIVAHEELAFVVAYDEQLPTCEDRADSFTM